MSDTPHARTFDLPGWPSPPKVADIPDHKDSYGWIIPQAVLADDEGLLWVDGLVSPQPSPAGLHIAVLVAWCEDGIAVYIPPTGYSHLHRDKATSSEVPREPYWLPVARVLPEPPQYANPV